MKHEIRAMSSFGAALVGMCAAYSLQAQQSSTPGNVTEQRVIEEAATGANWLVTGGDFGSSHFSPLKRITSANVNTLGLAWSAEVDSPMGLALEPIVVDGVIYIAASLDRVSAIDAVSGKTLWKFDPHTRLSVMRNSATARTNRGVAVWKGKVFFGTGDCRMIALDAATGKQLWQSPVCVDDTQTGITGAPRVGGDKVYIGYNGSDTAVRGSVVAFDVNTGKLAWRFWNVPGDPSKGFENKALETAVKTWKGTRWWAIGGGDVWDPITYDASTGLLIYGTAGAHGGGFAGDQGDDVTYSGSRLYAGCIVAVNAKTGEYAWHYQTDIETENFHIIVNDLTIDGAKRHVVMTVPRTGIFYVIDAKTGKLISQKPSNTGVQPTKTAAGLSRTSIGHNWWPMSFNPGTGLVYIPEYEGAPKSPSMTEAAGRLVAWDPLKQTARWSVALPISTNGGVLSTAGDLVFHGEGTGEFDAYSAGEGKKLWSVKTGSSIQSVPVSYLVNGEQYVLMPVGLGSHSRNFGPISAMATRESKLGPSRLLAFKLGAKTAFPYPKIKIPAVPMPPPQTASAELVRSGSKLYEKFHCSDCHSPEMDGAGIWKLEGTIPDLRYMPEDVHQQFLAIVMGGSRRQNGMPGFADGKPNFPLTNTIMSPDDANAIHAYIVEQQWKAYKDDQARAPNRGTP